MSRGLLEILVTVGLPGSGKTTFAKKLVKNASHKIHYISPDDHLYQNGTYVWSKDLVEQAWATSYHHLGLLLRKYGSHPRATTQFLWDATLTTRFVRNSLLNICRGFGTTVTAYYFPTPLEVCLARNALRSADRRVPEHLIQGAAEKLEVPTTQEGFAEVKVITG